MTESAILKKLRAMWAQGRLACVGLDSDIESPDFPAHLTPLANPVAAVLTFNEAIIKATAKVAGMFKPNEQFYRKLGAEGARVLIDTFAMLHRHAPQAVKILDAKPGDIGNSNKGTIKFAFKDCGADAITLNPYMGAHFDPDPAKCDGLQNFLECADRGVIVLCRTSNKGAGWLQDRLTVVSEAEMFQDFGISVALAEEFCNKGAWYRLASGPGSYLIPFYQLVALTVDRKWNKNGNCALVIGANNPKQLKLVRELCPDIPFLNPAFGKQMEGEENIVKQTIFAGLDSQGGGMICNNSRKAVFASKGTDFAEAAAAFVQKFSDEIAGFRADWLEASKQ